jgi:potassium efflux system protein
MSIRILRYAAARLLALILLALVLTQAPAFAQGSDPDLIASQQQLIGELSTRTTELEKKVQANRENDAVLLEIRLELEDLARELLQAGVAFRPRLNEINARLESLGPPPAEGQPAEAEIVVNERQSLANEKNQINVLIGDAETASIRANKLMTQIGDMRRDLFTSTLSKRYEINYTLLGEVAQEFKTEMSDLYRSVSSWLNFALKNRLPSVLAAAFFAVGAALLILMGGRRLIGGLIYKDPLDSDPSYLARLSVAFWTTLLRSLSVGVFLLVTWFFFDYFSVLRGDIGQMLTALFYVIALVYFVHRLTRSVLSPNLPNWQLIAVAPGPARLLVWLATATALATSVDYLLSEIFAIQSAPVTVSVGESLVATVIVGLLVLLIARVKPFLDEQGRPLVWPLWLRLTLYLVGGATIIAALLGYIGLAKFVSQQIVVTGAILATMYIGFLSARAISEVGAFGGTSLGRWLGKRFHVDDAGFDQLGLILSILINVMVLFAGVPLILLQWGFQWLDIRSAAYSIATEIKIGTVSFSLIGILTGIVVFALGFLATRWFQSWLDGSVMARGRVDAGVRNSIRTAVGYAGVALAGLIGVSAAGIDLSNLALVAGALSLGIGFGLQNVVSNFVSGLILLAERPFKVGDWVVAGAVSGTVKRISVRATEIETFQRQTVIMPNSELINAAVGNWTHRNKLGRIEIPIGVAYGSDVRKVHQLLLDIARAHPLALKNPEPFVLFAAFGASSLDFEIRLFLSDVLNGSIVQNDIRFAIIETFDREGIDIPYPHRKLLMDFPQPAAVAHAGPAAPAAEPPAAEPPAAKPAPSKRRRKPDPD